MYLRGILSCQRSLLSCQRRLASRKMLANWMPASAGMTAIYMVSICIICALQGVTNCWAEQADDTYVYQSEALRDPFEMVNILPNDPAAENRKREPLEWYPLDSLRMIGSLAKSGEYWALILDGRGRVHRVGLGNYLGQNAGKIDNIDDKKIAITEWLLDGQGSLQKRQVFLHLS